MMTIKLTLTNQKNQRLLLLNFPYNNEIVRAIKQIKSSKWSQSMGLWYVPYCKEVLYEIKEILAPICLIDAEKLKEQLKSETILKAQNEYIISVAKTKIERFEKWMRSKRYSPNTISVYSEAIITFLKFNYQKPIESINHEDIVYFNNEYILKNRLSSSYQNQVINAIKLFFRQIENKVMDVDLIHRPRREKVLPNVLSKEEVRAILKAHRNIKHRAMLSLIYSCGLRRSELLNLKPRDIDSKRGIIVIRLAKGKKDRMVPLSNKILLMLRIYFEQYRPKQWLFEGQTVGEQYNEKSLESVLKQALVKAKITKPVSLHWLRHSYATHLLESGTDLRYIQELLGHKSSRTTEIYTHVSTKNIENMKSPFDDLDM